jgi:hypothetical protein
MTWPLFPDRATWPADPQVLRRWRADRAPFWVVAVLLADPDVQRRRAAAAAALPGLAPSTPGQAHVTVMATGGHRPAVPAREVDLQVRGADSFATAAFLHADGMGLRAARSALAGESEVDPWQAWVPHVTVGTYCAAVPRAAVAEALAPWRDAPPIQVRGRLGVYRLHRRTGLLVRG